MRGVGVEVSFPIDRPCVKLDEPKDLARLRAPNTRAAGFTGRAAGELAFHTYLPHGQATVSVGSFFCNGWRHTGQFLHHIGVPLHFCTSFGVIQSGREVARRPNNYD